MWIPFTSEQIKDASPVTYDDAGKVIPLSERFDTTQQDIRYSVRETDQLDEDKYFSRIVDKWDGTSSGGRMKVGQIKTGSIYTAVGLPAGELFFDYSKAAKALGKHGDHLTKDSIKQIPKMLSNPIVITEPINEHVKNTINVFGEMIGDNGKPIMVSIMMRPDVSGTYLLNIVRTFEMRSDVNRLITPDTLLYITENKKRAQDWFLRLGNKDVPFAVNQYGLIRSIAYTNENSNPSGEKFSLRDQTNTPEFQRWFKDSEVVDDEGNPLVVYHTTDSDFTTFDSSFLGSITDSNAADGYLAATAHVGFWFNTQDLTPKMGGGKAMPVYLSSQRMYEVGTLDALTSEIWDTYTDDYDTEDPSIESAADAGEGYRRYLESRVHP